MLIRPRYLALVIVIVAVTLVVLNRHENPGPSLQIAQAAEPKTAKTPTVNSASQETVRPVPAPKAMRSLGVMISTMANARRPGVTLDDLLKELENQHPFLVQDSNEATGELTIVRTKKPLPGTRYFHAQYLGDGHRRFLQTISFEFEPAQSAMEDATNAVRNSFQLTGQPTTQAEGYRQWNLPDGYVVRVKRLTKEDLEHNPYNAYEASDAGTVEVTLEMNQEDSE